MRSKVSTFGLVAAFAVLAALSPLTGAIAAGPESVAELAGTLSPAVVNISSSRHVPFGQGVPFPIAPEGSPLNDLFDDLNPNEGQGEERMREAESLGSGFIISADGLVVTNNHVIEGAEEILIYLQDGTRLPAELVGADDKTDLAVLKVDAGRDLPFVSFGDSDSAEVGDWVMAIGNPFGLGGSVTLGIVSARNRDIQAGPYDNFIQTDAAINQGNSGGPLFDMEGNVVGINTAIIAQGGSALGIGFAVPGNLAKAVVGQLSEFGETRRGWIGVGIQDITLDIAESLGRPDTHGALVVNVTPEGPADGVLEEGDIILQFNGQDILRMRDLPRIVAETPIGEAVDVMILRDGEEQTYDVTLGRLELNDDTEVAELAPPADDVTEPEPLPPGLLATLGLDVGPLTDAIRNSYGIEPGVEGVAITSVLPGSDAEDKGLIPGLVVNEVNQQRIATVEDVTMLVDQAKEQGRAAVLFKLSDPAGSSRFVAVRLN
jgi:serine protease Do